MLHRSRHTSDDFLLNFFRVSIKPANLDNGALCSSNLLRGDGGGAKALEQPHLQ